MTRRSVTEKKLRLAVIFFMMAVLFLAGVLITGEGPVEVAFVFAAAGALLITVFMRKLYCYRGISGRIDDNSAEDADSGDDCGDDAGGGDFSDGAGD